MADFAGLLKKTIEAQTNPTPQLRERVYARARETVERKLAATAVPQKVVREQLQALEDAIKSVEAEYLRVEHSLLSTISTQNSNAAGLGNNAGRNAANQPPVPPQSPEKKYDPLKSSQTQITGNQSVTSRQPDSRVAPLNKQSAGAAQSAKPSQMSDAKNASSLSLSNKVDQKSYGSRQVTASVKKVPDAEPVNMDNILEAERQFARDQRSREAQATRVLASQSQGNDYDIVSDIFVQAAKRTERKAARKKALIIAGVSTVVALVVFAVLFSAWHFLSGRDHRNETPVPAAATDGAEQTVIKLTQRLMPDGSEVDVGPAQGNTKTTEEGTSTAAGTPAKAPDEQPGEAVFYQARTDDKPEKVETGSVEWSLVKEDANSDHAGELAIRGTVTIPDEKLSLRLTLRRNTDSSLPAAYLLEMIFIVPDNFEGKAIDNVHELTFKDSEQSPGQQLAGTIEAKIDDDFFLFALSGANPFHDRNLQLMKQLNWIRVVVTDKNKRVSELTFSKGANGEKVFQQVIDQWMSASKKPTLYDQNKQNEQTNTDQPGEATDGENTTPTGQNNETSNVSQSGDDNASQPASGENPQNPASDANGQTPAGGGQQQPDLSKEDVE